jgi:hypothetical protein
MNIIKPKTQLNLAESIARPAAEREAAYQAALKLIKLIDPLPGSNRLSVHWRSKSGVLLRTLDEVVRAILADELILPETAELELA